MNDVSRPAPPAWRGDLIAAGLTALWLVVMRRAFECPWGFSPVAGPDGLHVGIPFNVGDTWSYLSWARQYQAGHFAASLLYTTEPHAARLWVFPLWLDGRLAALTGLPLLGVYSVLGAVGAAAAVVALRRAAATIGLDRAALGWATVALVLGSGASWLWHVAHRFGVAPPADGAEFFYTDLFPSTAFLVHPYHAQSLALLASLWWAVATAERRLADHRSATGPLIATALLGALLTFSRPYEPLVFALAYGVKAAWSFLVRRREPEAWRSTWPVLLVLGVGLLPGLAWNAFVSLQPVWSSFAHRSLVQGFPRAGWLTAFGGLWLLGALGVASCRRLPRLAGALPIVATALSAILLLATAHAPAKLASGLAIGIALLAGAGAAAIVRRLRAQLRPWTAAAAGSLVLAGLLGTPSLAMALLQVRLNQQATLDPSFDRLAHRIPALASDRPSLVLTDPAAGEVLPGLIGVRVYAGHFSLTVDYETKRAELRRAGLDPEHPLADAAASRETLDALLIRIAPDYALLDARCGVALDELARRGWRSVAVEGPWHLLQAPAAVR